MKFVIFTMLCLLSSISFSQLNCSKYRTGKFEIMNHDGSISKIKRNSKFQFEKTPVFKGKDRIVWIDDCTYQLHPVKINDKSGIVGPEVLTFKIVVVGEHHYVFEATGLGNSVIPGKIYEEGYLNYDKK